MYLCICMLVWRCVCLYVFMYACMYLCVLYMHTTQFQKVRCATGVLQFYPVSTTIAVVKDLAAQPKSSVEIAAFGNAKVYAVPKLCFPKETGDAATQVQDTAAANKKKPMECIVHFFLVKQTAMEDEAAAL